MKPYTFVIIFIASQFFLCLGLFVSLAYAQPSVSDYVSHACNFTRFPITCQNSLIKNFRFSFYPAPLELIDTAVSVTYEKLQDIKYRVQSLLNINGNPNLTRAAQNCVDFLASSDYWTYEASNKALPRRWIKDARAWMSAAMQYQYDCWSALKYVNDTELVNRTISNLEYEMELTSNAVTLLFCYDNYGEQIAAWAPPKSERDGFWEAGREGVRSVSGLSAGIPSNLKIDLTVCKDFGSPCHIKIQEAVDRAPFDEKYGNFVIYIKEGVYEETVRIPLRKKNVVFLGDGMGKTVITGSLKEVGIPTYDTATVGVDSEGFMAKGLTIQNTAGPDAHQGVAFRSGSDFSIIEDCEFLGNQETIYAQTLRQFYKSCRIEGNVDIIFGSAAAVFQDCQILVRPQQLSPQKAETDAIVVHGRINLAITAHGRIDVALTAGFVFQSCSINGTEEFMRLYYSNPQAHNTFLGRPWKKYARTVFINSSVETLISPQGWMPWDETKFALKTLYFGEYGNTGPGSNLSKRVPWSSLIPAEHVPTYSVENFLMGNGSNTII